MNSSTVGSLDWARKTRGLLDRRERAGLAARAIAAQMKLVPARLRYRVGLPYTTASPAAATLCERRSTSSRAAPPFA